MKLTREILGIMLCCLSLFFLIAPMAGAQDLQKIKAQMVERKPAIDALKSRGVIGEGNDGYLHIRQKEAGADKVVNAENADRRTVNSMIARKEGSSVEQVSKAAAKRLRDYAAPGNWVQKDDGSWQKK